jgi:adenylosuccinate synthase
MLVDPHSPLREERYLQTLGIIDALERLTIDQEALVTTPCHQALNRLREVSHGSDRHGSCGMGIVSPMADALALGERVLRMGDLHDLIGLKQELRTLCDWKTLAMAGASLRLA